MTRVLVELGRQAGVIEAADEGAPRVDIEVDTVRAHVEEDAQLDVQRMCRGVDASHVADRVDILRSDLEDPVGLTGQQARDRHRGITLDVDLDAVDRGSRARVVLVGLEDPGAVLADLAQLEGPAPEGDDGGIEEAERGGTLVSLGGGEDLAQRPEAIEQVADVGVLVEEAARIRVGLLVTAVPAWPG